MFAKIFTQIFDSSIAESPEVRFTFMDLLVLADLNGVVDMTHEAIARRTNRPLDVVRSTIATLEAPDPDSRTKDHEGRRLKRLDAHRDWGWVILNYSQFRAIASEEQRREKTLARVHKFRTKRPVTPCNADVTPPNAPVTGANAGNAMQMQMQMQREKQMEDAKANPLPECVEFPAGKPNKGNANGARDLQLKLNSMFGRDDSRWDPEDERLLVAIVQRPNWAAEFSKLEKFKDREPDYFPQSVGTLLNKWANTLDRAGRPPKPRQPQGQAFSNSRRQRQILPDGTEITENNELDPFKPPMENGREIQLPDPRRKAWERKIVAQAQ